MAEVLSWQDMQDLINEFMEHLKAQNKLALELADKIKLIMSKEQGNE